MLRLDGKVAVITGAGGGLGREYAILLASRGASIVVNDLGTSTSGDGKSVKAADDVVKEIQNFGGKAVANYESVERGDSIIKAAMQKYGRVDVLINNAGILRDKTFKNMSEDDWDTIFNVHIKGSYSLTKAVWQHMCKQGSGSIIMTSSNSGIYGNFGQTNYAAAKAALIGFAKSLSIEGAKFGVRCNVVVPTAASRLTTQLLPLEVANALHPRHVAPLVIWLCHENCRESGGVFEAGAGWFGKVTSMRSNGIVLLDKSGNVQPETVMENWSSITDMEDGGRRFDTVSDELTDILEKVKPSGATVADSHLLPTKDSFLTDKSKERSRSSRFSPVTVSYGPKDVILYALATGANLSKNSNLLNENHEQFCVFPLFSVVLSSHIVKQLIDFNIPRVNLDYTRMVHGEQYLEFKKPLLSSAKLVSYCRLVDILDKGNASIVLLDTEIKDSAGNLFVKGQYNLFFKNAGNFNGPRDSDERIKGVSVPQNRKPDFVFAEKTSPDQAAIYRQASGDFNPLHIDTDFAKLAGFKQPILHGLCVLGFSVRHVVDKFHPEAFNQIKSIKVRFAKPVFPGQTLVTEMWRGDNDRIHFQTKVKETGNVVLTDGYVDFLGGVEVLSSSSVISKPVVMGLKSAPVFSQLKNKLHSEPGIVKQVQAVYQWVITKDGKASDYYVVDLKNAPGSIYNGQCQQKPDVTLTIDDQDMVDLVAGSLNPQKAFMTGKLKIQGNIMLTQRLQKLFQSKANL